MLQEFKEFAMRGNVVDMAVGIVIGSAFGTIVKSFVDDVLMPPIGLATGGVDFKDIFWTLKGPDAPTVEQAQEAGAVTLNIGLFVNAIISFLIIAFALFLVIQAMNRLKRKQVEEPEKAPPPPRQEVLLEEIRNLLAKRG